MAGCSRFYLLKVDLLEPIRRRFLKISQKRKNVLADKLKNITTNYFKKFEEKTPSVMIFIPVIYILVALCAVAVIFAPDVTSINAVYNGATIEGTEIKSSDFSVTEILDNGSKQKANPSDISIDKK